MKRVLVWSVVLGGLLWGEADYIGCSDDYCTGFYSRENRHGVVLKSDGKMYKFSRSRGFEVVSGVKIRKFTLYVGKSCDTYSKRYGRGFWEWANGGFILYFKGTSFAFPRQEIYIDNIQKCYAR